MRWYELRFPSGSLASAFIYDTDTQADGWRWKLGVPDAVIVEVVTERRERVIG